ncbi:hypothetical protein SOI71_14655 [Acinetobacter pittii]|jgi:hypothetical protein|uniref:hypothetical protein n=1 Tax=Acinetobacter TaxID=469 RepID=UPI000CE3B0EE|nr:hypothetical protein [Acinetobacter pittii]PPB99856.1 hypothetical protein ApiMCR53_14080 [Acinetobacter pittii]WPP76562.1 hypothetical protein SOI71_14655 [Acinetobacter pittii]
MSICDDARQTGIDKLNAAYTPLINEITRIIKNMQNKGLDPHKYYDPVKDQVIDLIALLSDLGVTRDQQLADLNAKIDKDCVQTMEFLQSIVDFVVLSITNGLSAVLPKHMTHIDVGEILAGKPLGGDNSVFNDVRGGILNAMALGENNDLRKVIEDPVTTAKDSVNEALEKAGLPFRL